MYFLSHQIQIPQKGNHSKITKINTLWIGNTGNTEINNLLTAFQSICSKIIQKDIIKIYQYSLNPFLSFWMTRSYSNQFTQYDSNTIFLCLSRSEILWKISQIKKTVLQPICCRKNWNSERECKSINNNNLTLHKHWKVFFSFQFFICESEYLTDLCHAFSTQ